jgi:hypothetical protein
MFGVAVGMGVGLVERARMFLVIASCASAICFNVPPLDGALGRLDCREVDGCQVSLDRAKGVEGPDGAAEGRAAVGSRVLIPRGLVLVGIVCLVGYAGIVGHGSSAPGRCGTSGADSPRVVAESTTDETAP